MRRIALPKILGRLLDLLARRSDLESRRDALLVRLETGSNAADVDHRSRTQAQRRRSV
ncbi:hypothetical protein AB0H77_35620 [Streptomyces sp. NPDC050844]|uniref:hypothetical protein n=1 Tax=Streptomyces sp. NPDC050844 TaxID=3155790 RepID=UPI0033E0B768